MLNLKLSLRSKIVIVLSCFIAIVVSCIGIGAYFIDTDAVVNQFAIGENVIDIIEEFEPPEEIDPGDIFPKDVKVKNTGPVDCYVRIKALFSSSLMEQYCEIDWNNVDWIYNPEDGYYYYPEILVSGAETPSLMTTVKIKDDAPEGQIAGFNIIVYAESYQSYGFDKYQDAWVNYQKNRSQ